MKQSSVILCQWLDCDGRCILATVWAWLSAIIQPKTDPLSRYFRTIAPGPFHHNSLVTFSEVLEAPTWQYSGLWWKSDNNMVMWRSKDWYSTIVRGAPSLTFNYVFKLIFLDSTGCPECDWPWSLIFSCIWITRALVSCAVLLSGNWFLICTMVVGTRVDKRGEVGYLYNAWSSGHLDSSSQYIIQALKYWVTRYHNEIISAKYTYFQDFTLYVSTCSICNWSCYIPIADLFLSTEGWCKLTKAIMDRVQHW